MRLQCSRTCAFKEGLQRPGTMWLDTCCSSQAREEFLREALWPVRENKKEGQTGDIVGGDRMTFSQDTPSF